MKAVRQLIGVGLVVGFCGVTALSSADDTPKKVPGEKRQLVGGRVLTPPAAPVVLHVKSFRCKQCDPAELRMALSQLLQGGGAGSNMPGLVSAGSKTLAPGAVMPGSLSGPYWVVDERTRTLVVRGQDAEIEKIAGLIEVLEAEPGKSPSTNNALHVVRLKHAKVDEAVQALNGLHLNHQVVALPKSNLLIVPATSANVKEIDEVIEALDIEGAVQPKEKPATETKREKKKKP